MKKAKKEVSLTPYQQQKLTEWAEKIKSGEAYKIAENELKNVVYADSNPKQWLNRFTEVICPKIYQNGKLTDEEQKEFYKIVMSYGLDNSFSMLEAIEDRYRGLIQGLREELIKEFNCITYRKKALVDLAINAYSRNLTMSRFLVNTINMGHTTAILNNFLGVISKEIDRANRQFITALDTLRQFKQPELKVNVKTNTAFISQNQQINANQNKQNETNEVK